MPSSARSIASIAYCARCLGPRLQVRLVDLDDVGARSLQVAQLLVDRGRVRERERALVAVEVVLRLLRHRERAGNRDLDPTGRERAEEPDVAHLDRPSPPDLADHPRHRVRVAGAIERDAGLVEVDAVERGREAVAVALAAHLAVGDDVDARTFHVGDGKPRRVVLRLLEIRLGDAPQLAGADARRQARRRAGRGRSARAAAGSCRRRWSRVRPTLDTISRYVVLTRCNGGHGNHRRRQPDRPPRPRRHASGPRRCAVPRARVPARGRVTGAGRRRRAARVLLRGRADRVRLAARPQRQRVPAPLLARARDDPLRPDGQLRRAGTGGSATAPRRRARSAPRTARTRCRSCSPATA